MKPVEFHHEAHFELLEAAYYVDLDRTGYGDRFLSGVKDTLETIQTFPESGSPSDIKPYRKWGVHGFRYNIIYRVEADRIYVIAVAH